MKKSAQIIKSSSEKIMKDWERYVVENISASNATNPLALRNQLPHLLNDVAEIMNRYDDFEEVKSNEHYEEIIKNSLDHGRHRATSTHYTVSQIIEEYIAFHRILTNTLRDQDVYTTEVGILLKYTIETAMLNSASSFTDSLQHMREKLIGTLAHDIRNPLSTAYLFIETLRYEDGKERFDKAQKMTLKSLSKSIGLIEGLLDAISVKAGEGITLDFKKVNIAKDIRWVYNEASEIYLNPIKFDYNGNEIVGVFDDTAIRRIVENLVTNATKYGRRNSPVVIKLRDKGKNVMISVHNEGNPIPKQNQVHIFNFLRTEKKKKNSLKSWGMGLTLVKIVAEAHGGYVELVSNKEEGTTFTIILNKQSNTVGKMKSELNCSNDI